MLYMNENGRLSLQIIVASIATECSGVGGTDGEY